jgi:hypothetical protein
MPIPPADLVILPGSKSVRADLAFLRANGWDRALQRHLRYGGKLIGICGGMQMLGRSIHDPDGREGLRARATASRCSISKRRWRQKSSCGAWRGGLPMAMTPRCAATRFTSGLPKARRWPGQRCG